MACIPGLLHGDPAGAGASPRWVGAILASPGRVVSWLGRRHRLPVEAALVVGFYLLYDGSRGIGGAGRDLAVRHSLDIARLEGAWGLAVERPVQRAVEAAPHLMTVFDLGYMSLHLGVTLAVLGWAYLRRPDHFAVVRTALLVVSGLALVGFVTFPAAPPRLAGLGIVDTVSGQTADLGSDLLQLFYNPYAAFPSIHVGYAVVAGGAVAWLARHRVVRLAGALYPLFVTAEVVATGNHYLLDVVAGLGIAVIGGWVAHRLVAHRPRHPDVGRPEAAPPAGAPLVRDRAA